MLRHVATAMAMTMLLGPAARGFADEPANAQLLNKGLSGLRVISVEPKRVRYLPRQIVHVDRAGKPLATFASLLNLGEGKMLAQSVLSIQPGKDGEALTKAVRESLGKEVEVKVVIPERFRLRLFLDGKEVFNRPLAAGSITNIPIVAEVNTPRDGAVWEADVEMEWSEVITSKHLKLEIQWRKVAETLANNSSGKGEFTRAVWVQTLAQGLVLGTVSLTAGERKEQPASLDLLLLAIETQVLETAGIADGVEQLRLQAKATKETRTYEFQENKRVVLRDQFRWRFPK